MKKFNEVMRGLGIAFGGIAVTPIYTLSVIFFLLPVTKQNIFSMISLIVWTLIIVIFIGYVWLAISLNNKESGGIVVLKELIKPKLKSKNKIAIISLISFIGIAFMIGRGAVAPSMSILSSVEGLRLIQGLKINRMEIIIIAIMISIIVFGLQKNGTTFMSKIFGPIMLIWFIALFICGLISILKYPQILFALNPQYAFYFLKEHKISSFFLLSSIILCAAGGEALYINIGHIGQKPIIKGWILVFMAIVVSYLGQGVYLLNTHDTSNILYSMVQKNYKDIFIPFLILSLFVTVISSQAIISGIFSVVYQSIVTRIMPLFKIKFTSEERKAQIYIGVANWFLLFFVIVFILIFKYSDKLASVYIVTSLVTMTVTSVLVMLNFLVMKGVIIKKIASVFVTFVLGLFCLSILFKFPVGGYWAIIISSIPFTMILIYVVGQKKLYKLLRNLKLSIFVPRFKMEYSERENIKGTALYFSKNIGYMPPYIVKQMFNNKIIYDENIIVTIKTTDNAYGINSYFSSKFATGLSHFKIELGYMETPCIAKILKNHNIDFDRIFYGIDRIETSNLLWKIFFIMKELSTTYLEFYELPVEKLNGILTMIKF